MAAPRKADAAEVTADPSATPEPAPRDVTTQAEFGRWLFLDAAPTVAEVAALLESVPAVLGVRVADFADYVQALPQKMKIDHPNRTGHGPKETVDHQAWVIYVSVAGRVRMAQKIAEQYGWRLDFEPEPVTPTGVPGYVELGDRLVYREYAVFTRLDPDDVYPADPLSTVSGGTVLGRRPGTAWAPRSGGKAAAGSNPYEKAETAARGRALAAWGIGVLPGSGIASVEEISAISDNRAAVAAAEHGAGRTHGRGETPRESHDDLVEQVMGLSERFRQRKGWTSAQRFDALARSLAQVGVQHVEQIVNVEHEVVDWQRVRDGQLVLVRNRLQEALRDLADAEQAP